MTRETEKKVMSLSFGSGDICESSGGKIKKKDNNSCDRQQERHDQHESGSSIASTLIVKQDVRRSSKTTMAHGSRQNGVEKWQDGWVTFHHH